MDSAFFVADWQYEFAPRWTDRSDPSGRTHTHTHTRCPSARIPIFFHRENRTNNGSSDYPFPPRPLRSLVQVTRRGSVSEGSPIWSIRRGYTLIAALSRICPARKCRREIRARPRTYVSGARGRQRASKYTISRDIIVRARSRVRGIIP